MVKGLKLCALLLGAAIICGCGQKNSSATLTTSLKVLPEKRTLKENNPAKGTKLVNKAKSAIGTPYVYGGSAPGGFDCSGLVKWAYNSVGVNLPRTAREQSVVGKKVNNIKDMRAGDIVAFRHPKRGYHTGIYLGDGKFVHSPRKRTHVRINSLSDPYFSSTLLGARRVNLDGSENLIAQSEERLRQFVAEKSELSLSPRNLEKIKSAAKSKRAHQLAQKSDKKPLKTVASKKDTSKATRADSKKVSHADSRKVAKADTGKRKSTIATQARKIQSVKAVTGKSKPNGKNGEAHAKLANASKKASQKTVSMLNTKQAHKSAPKGRSRS